MQSFGVSCCTLVCLCEGAAVGHPLGSSFHTESERSLTSSQLCSSTGCSVLLLFLSVCCLSVFLTARIKRNEEFFSYGINSLIISKWIFLQLHCFIMCNILSIGVMLRLCVVNNDFKEPQQVL